MSIRTKQEKRRMSSLKTLMQSRKKSLSETADLSGVDMGNLSRAQNLVGPLSLESARKVGKTLDVDGILLYAASQVETAQKKVASGETSPGEGLRVVGKVAGVLKDRVERGQLPESRSLELMLDGIEAAAEKFVEALDDASQPYSSEDDED